MARENHSDRQTTGPVLEELEPRILYSADLPLADLAAPAESVIVAPYYSDSRQDGAQQQLVDDDEALALADANTAADEPAAIVQLDDATEADGPARELVFVNTDVPDYEQLIEDLLAERPDGRSFSIILLDSNRDGIAQVNQALEEESVFSAIHFISHGEAGSVSLGNATLDFDSLLNNAGAISRWGNALTDDGDLLIYGCNLAASDEGKNLVNALARLTDADVAASDDLTGNAARGGDWELEYQRGDIESGVALSTTAQDAWSGTLAATTFYEKPCQPSGQKSLFRESRIVHRRVLQGAFSKCWCLPVGHHLA